MSSSRPSDTGTGLPDPPSPLDLPDDDGASAPDLFGELGAPEPEPEPGELPGAHPRSTSRPAPEPSLRERLSNARRRVRPWSAWTLRAKLVASMLALFTVLSLATGAFTVVALGRHVTGQVDAQLRSSVVRLLSDRRGIDLGIDTDGGPPRGPGDEG